MQKFYVSIFERNPLYFHTYFSSAWKSIKISTFLHQEKNEGMGLPLVCVGHFCIQKLTISLNRYCSDLIRHSGLAHSLPIKYQPLTSSSKALTPFTFAWNKGDRTCAPVAYAGGLGGVQPPPRTGKNCRKMMLFPKFLFLATNFPRKQRKIQFFH